MRNPARLLLSGAALVLSASCIGDQAVSPHAIPDISGNPALRALAVAQTVDLTIPVAGGSVSILGVYTLEVPAGAVCDPNAADTQTGYANHDWDASCTPATGDTPIQATVKYSAGKLYVDFAPALRFVPSKTVRLSTDILAPTVAYFGQNDLSLGFEFPYASAIDASGVADALTDPSLRTVVVGSTGKVYRRVKHFSGYFIVTGEGYIPCDPMAGDSRCVWTAEE
jgi:hypothetical protein